MYVLIHEEDFRRSNNEIELSGVGYTFQTELSSYFMPIVLAISLILVCVQLRMSLESFRKAAVESYRLKYALYERPRDAVPSFCASMLPIKGLVSCRSELYWKRSRRWIPICAHEIRPHHFPRRYYKIVVQCYLAKKKVQRLRVHWKILR